MRLHNMKVEEFGQLVSEGKIVKSHNLFRPDIDHSHESYVGKEETLIRIVTLDELNTQLVGLELTPEDLVTLFKIIRTSNSKHLIPVMKFPAGRTDAPDENVLYIEPHTSSKTPILKADYFNFSYSALENAIFGATDTEYSEGYSYWFNSVYLTIIDESKGSTPVMIHRNTLMNSLASIIALNLTTQLETSYLLAGYSSHSYVEENYLKLGSAYLAMEKDKITVLSEKLFYYATTTQGDVTEEIKSTYDVKAGRLLKAKVGDSTSITIDFLDHTDEISVNVIDITEEAEYGGNIYLTIPGKFANKDTFEEPIKSGLSLSSIFGK